MSSNYYQKRRKPNNYFRSNKKQKEFVLKAGLKGFLCTCNAREGDCIREAYNILNEYADKLHPLGSPKNDSKHAAAEKDAAGSGDDPEDIDAALEKELCSLKEEANKKPGQRKFQVVESGTKNCLFIQTTVPEPVELVLSILEDLDNTKEQKCRFLQRLLPIEATCRATIEDVRATLEPLLDKYLAKESKTFAIMFTRRNSSALNRDEVIESLAEMVSLKNTGNRADLKSPQLSIMVEVVRGICCLAVLPDYFRLKKYNLLELIAPEKSVDDSVDSGTQGGGTNSKETDDVDPEQTDVTEVGDGSHSKETDDVHPEQIGVVKVSDGTQSEEGVRIYLKDDNEPNAATSKNELDTSEVSESQKSTV